MRVRLTQVGPFHGYPGTVESSFCLPSGLHHSTPQTQQSTRTSPPPENGPRYHPSPDSGSLLTRDLIGPVIDRTPGVTVSSWVPIYRCLVSEGTGGGWVGVSPSGPTPDWVWDTEDSRGTRAHVGCPVTNPDGPLSRRWNILKGVSFGLGDPTLPLDLRRTLPG